MPNENSQDIDEEIVERIRSRDETGLQLLMTRYGGRVKGYLVNQFGKTLMEHGLDSALSDAIIRVWKYIESYDRRKGTLRSWFLRIAQHSAIDIVSEQKRHATEPFDIEQLACPASDEASDSFAETASFQKVTDLEFVIENKLQGLQQAIIKADLHSNNVASATRLAAIHGTSKNSIYVSRQKARANIKTHMRHLAEERAGGEHE